MSRALRLLGFVAVGVICACATTRFDSTWKDPTAQPVNPAGKTVAAVFINPEEGRRRAGEDALARAITAQGARGVAAYTILPATVREDGNKARDLLVQNGVNGVVIMRIVSERDRITYTPGWVSPGPYGRFGPYWGWGWQTAYQPGWLSTDTIVSVDTRLYALGHDEDKLLWAGTSQTTNPSRIDSFVTEVANTAAREMTRQGLLVR
jgi:hypothetical protein